MQLKKYYSKILCVFFFLLFCKQAYCQNDESDELLYYKEQISNYQNNENNPKILEYKIKLGTAYWHNGQNKNALSVLDEALKLALQLKDWQLQIRICGLMADIYKSQKDYKTAEQYGLDALSTARDYGNYIDIAIALINLSQLSYNDYRTSIDCLKQAEYLCKKIEDSNLLSRCYFLMAAQYRNAGNEQKSKEYKDLANEIIEKKHLSEITTIKNNAQKNIKQNNLENQKKLEEINKQKKIYLDSLEKTDIMYKNNYLQLKLAEQENITKNIIIKQQETEIKNQKKIRLLILTLLGLLVIFLSILLYLLKIRHSITEQLRKTNIEIKNKNLELNARAIEIEKQRTLIELKNNDIIDSINNAAKIQSALLPSQHRIKECFKDCFVLYMPKDIVSGNFYWFSQQDSYTFIAVADSTGSNLSGAYMGMVGNSLLNEIINTKHIFEPAEILDNINKGITQKTEKDAHTFNNNRMEITICRIDNQNKEIAVAAANQTIFLTHEDGIEEIQGDIHALGGSFDDKNEQKYHQEKTTFCPKSNIYLFTNGYNNQIGGDKQRKYMVSNFKNLVSKIKDMPMDAQLQAIKNAHNLWRGDNIQTNDILIIGITL